MEIKSALSGTKLTSGSAVLGSEIREGIFQLIRDEHPNFSQEEYISYEELNTYRKKYLLQLVEREKGELSSLDLDVMKAISENSILTEKLEDDKETSLSIGQMAADKIATFGGSWTFVLSFLGFLTIWIIANIWFLANKGFDPYPFILLNLILSCVAALQAPIIMMSQNRQEEKDRKRAEHDYKINLKAELEIKLLSEKIDHLILHQNKKLIEIQEVQIDYLEDLTKRVNSK